MLIFKVPKCYKPFIGGKHMHQFHNVLWAARLYTQRTGKPCLFKAHQLFLVFRRRKLEPHEMRPMLTAVVEQQTEFPWDVRRRFR